MAFVSMIIAFLAIVGVVLIGILVILAIIGTIFFIVGLIKRKKAISQGKKYYVVFITIGSILLSLPLLLVGGVFACSVINKIETDIKRQSYENCIDKWKNEWVSSNEVREDVIKEFFDAADNKDKEALMALYSDEIQQDSELKEQVEEFLDEYPGGLVDLKFDYKGGHEEGSSDYGVSSEYLNARYEVKKGDEYYYISFGGYYENDEEPDKIGLDYFVINSEKGEVISDESDEERDDEEHIIANIDIEENFETRRVAGIPYKYVEKDIIYTREEVLEAIKESYDLYDLYSYLGEPNGVGARLNYVVYEIESNENDYRYIEITHTDAGEIVKDLTCIVGTEEGAIIHFDENIEEESTEN